MFEIYLTCVETRSDGAEVENPIAREKLRKTVGKTIKKDLAVNDLSIDMIHNRMLWCC